MIITKLIGGVGNQMFQYAAGLVLSIKNDTSLKMDINFLLDKSPRYYRHTQRDYGMDMFRISGKIAIKEEISKFTLPRTGNKYLFHFKKRFTKEYHVFAEASLLKLNDFFEIPGNAYLDGYWQKYAFFSDYAEVVNNEYQFSNPISNDSIPIINQIKESNSVCVIFRRGDFVDHPELDILDLEYYYQSITIVRNNFPDAKFFIFSDDITWCKKYFITTQLNVVFVEECHTGKNGENYLQLIASCNHFIIPNSSFAWWGAWLGNSPNKLVIAPKKWYRSQSLKENPILPPEWISL
jgi:hypothetical protein